MRGAACGKVAASGRISELFCRLLCRWKASGCQGWALEAVGRFFYACVCILEPPLSAMYFWVEVEFQAYMIRRTGTIEERRSERDAREERVPVGKAAANGCVRAKCKYTSSVSPERR